MPNTQSDDERVVSEACAADHSATRRNPVRLSFYPGEDYLFQSWAEARIFTEQRRKQIAEKREEIRFLREDVSYNTHVDAERIIRRIRAVLEAQLAELLRGWRQK